MAQGLTVTLPTPDSSRVLARTTIALSAAFLVVLTLLHFLKPELDPSWRMISEYEIGRFGWLMRLAFFLWSGSVFALFLALRGVVPAGGGRVGRWWLLVLSVFLVGAGVFATLPITDPTVTTVDNLHALCGAIVILTFPIAATLTARGLSRSAQWTGGRRALLWTTVLVWVSLAVYFGSIIVSNLINPEAGRVGPHVLQGWPNRFMVLVYHVWLWVAARPLAGR